MELLYRFECKFVQAFAAVGYIFDDLIPHAALPESFEVIENSGHRLVVRIGSEKQGDLVRPMNHLA